MGSAPDADSDLEQQIASLTATATLGDAGLLRTLLVEHPMLTVVQAKKLFTLAVEQSTTGDVQLALEPASRQLFDLRESWAAAATAVRAVLEYGPEGAALKEGLTTYWDTTRAEKALKEMAPFIDRIEAALADQRDLLDLHQDTTTNYYLHQARRLTEIMTGPGYADAERLAAATGLLTSIDHYRPIVLPRLKSLSGDIEELMPACSSLAPLVPSTGPFPNAQRWMELTAQLVPARRAAIGLVELSIERDRVVPQSIADGRARTEAVEGKSRLVLDEASIALIESQAGRHTELEAEAAVEAPIAKERDELAARLRPRLSEESAGLVLPAVYSSRTGMTHPVTSETWFRLGQAGWWTAAFVAFVAAAYLARENGGMLVGSLVGAIVLAAVRSLVLLLALGRVALYERPGSGMVDLDMFEASYLHSREAQSSSALAAFAELRQRHGRRAPESAVRQFLDNQVSLGAAERRRFLEGAAGDSIPINTLRQRVTMAFSHVSRLQRERVMRQAERWLLRLEVRYGADVPASAGAEEADPQE